MNTPVEAMLNIEGLSYPTPLTLELYPADGGAIVNGAGDDMLEDGDRAGTYVAIVTEALEGLYEAKILDASGLVGGGLVSMEDDEEIHRIGIPVVMVADESPPTGQADFVEWEIEVLSNNGTPLAHAAVWISTDASGANVVAGTRYTNAHGLVKFYLDPGTYYVWRHHEDFVLDNPVEMEVTA